MIIETDVKVSHRILRMGSNTTSEVLLHRPADARVPLGGYCMHMVRANSACPGLRFALLIVMAVLPTTSRAASDDHFDLALRWAPKFYCDIHADNLRADVPTDINFDREVDDYAVGDGVITDNWDNLDRVVPAARVYYAVVATETHYFISYFLYHPRDWESLDKQRESDTADWPFGFEHEHDLEGLTLVVTNPDERFVVAYTQAHGDTYYFSDGSPFVPNCLELIEGGTVSSLDHRDGGYGKLEVLAENADMHFDGARPLAFVEREGHGIGQIRRAVEPDSSGPLLISGGSYRFYGDDGLVLTPSADGLSSQVPLEANQEYEYGLVSFAEQIWAQRKNVAWYEQFSATFTTMRGVTFSGMGEVFATGSGHYGGANPPWVWQELVDCPDWQQCLEIGGACGGEGNLGDWFLDPARFARYHIEDLGDFSLNYVDNEFLSGTNRMAVDTPPTWVPGSQVVVSWTVQEAPANESGISSLCVLQLIDASGNVAWTSSYLSTDDGQATLYAPHVPGGNYRIRVRAHSDVAGGSFLPITGTSGEFEIVGAGTISTLFGDDFSDDDLAPWTVYDGAWQQLEGVVEGVGNDHAHLECSDENWRIARVLADVNLLGGAQREINLRSDAGVVRVNIQGEEAGSQVQIYDGADYSYVSFPNESNRWYTVGLSVDAGTYSVDINGLPIAQGSLDISLVGHDFTKVVLGTIYGGVAQFDNVVVTGTYTGSSVNEGLVAYYPFSGNAEDHSDNANHGSPVGATLDRDRFAATASAFVFSGDGDYIDCGDVLNDLSVPFTFSAWIRAYDDGIRTVNRILSTDNNPDDSGAYYGFWAYLRENGVVSIGYGDGTGPSSRSRRSKESSDTVLLGHWAHVAAVVRGPADMSIYIDGEDAGGAYDGSGGALMVHNEYPFNIGSRRRWSDTIADQYFRGSIDEVRMYDRALSADEIGQLYYREYVDPGLLVFFGEDLGDGDDNTRPAGYPQAQAVQSAFTEYVVGVGWDGFESVPVSAQAPLVLRLTSGPDVLNGGGLIRSIPSGTGAGTYPTSGDQIWFAGAGVSVFRITFSEPITSIGFWATDVSDHGGALAIELDGDRLVHVPATDGAPSGSALFLAVASLAEPFTDVAFVRSGNLDDGIGIDDLMIGRAGGYSDVPDGRRANLVGRIALHQNAPNPFNPQTRLSLDVSTACTVNLRIFDLSGRLVRVLCSNKQVEPGRSDFVWNGRDDAGRQLASGTYFYRLESDGYSETKRMVLIR